MGTSLTVHPFASLTQLVPESCPRVLINMDVAGDIGSRPDDIILLGKTDDVVRDLCAELGDDWAEELDAMWKETEKYARAGTEEEKAYVKDAQAEERKLGVPEKDEDELIAAKRLNDEVDRLTEEVEKALQIGEVPQDEDKPIKAEEKPSLEEVVAEEERAPAEVSSVTKDLEETAKTEAPSKPLDEPKPTEGKL